MKISYNSQPQRNLIGNQIFKLRKSKNYPRRKWLPSSRCRAIISAN